MLVLCSVVSATAVQQLDSNLLYAQMTTTSGVEPSRRPSPRTRDCSTVLRFGLLFVVLSALIIIFQFSSFIYFAQRRYSKTHEDNSTTSRTTRRYQFVLLGEQRHRCVNNLNRVARGAERPGHEPATSRLKVRSPNHYTTPHKIVDAATCIDLWSLACWTNLIVSGLHVSGVHAALASPETVKPGFHYPSWRPELTARVDGWPVSITLSPFLTLPLLFPSLSSWFLIAR